MTATEPTTCYDIAFWYTVNVIPIVDDIFSKLHKNKLRRGNDVCDGGW